MTVGSWLRTLVGFASGQAQFRGLELIGALGDRWHFIYELDARISARRLSAHLRRLEAVDSRDRRRLRWSERSTWSQNGEDGVIEEIFARIGTTDRFFVEIGASDGQENCTRNLVEAGWTGIWVEADSDKAAAAKAVAPGVEVVDQPVFRDDVADVLAARGAPPTFDLLVVDIDGDDLGVLRRCLSAFRPRLVVVEYNATFTPQVLWAMGESRGGWDGTFRHGASIGSLQTAAERFGYVLVHCDRTGVNAFFVRKDAVGDHFPQAGQVRDLYRMASFTAHPFGHPRSRRALSPMAALEVDELRAVSVDRVEVLRRAPDLLGFVEIGVTLTNGTARWLTSGEPYAVRVSMRPLDQLSDRDAYRTALPHPIAPFASARVRLWCRLPADGQVHRLRVTVVCEYVGWREDLGGPGAYVDVDV